MKYLKIMYTSLEYSVLIFGFFLLAVTSCTPDLEYASADFEYVGFSKNNNIEAFEGTTGEIKVPVIYGGNLASERTVSVKVGVQSASTSTHGTEYQIVGYDDPNNIELVFAPGQTTDTLRIMTVDDLKEEEDKVLIFELTGGTENVSIAGYPRPNTFQITLKDDDCDFFLEDFLGTFVADEPGYGEYEVNFTADALVENRIIEDNFWDYGGTPYYDINPETFDIILPKQILVMGGDPYMVEGSGKISTCDGSMFVDYVVSSEDGSEVLDENTHTYTR